MKTFCEHLLLENRVDVLRDKYKDKLQHYWLTHQHVAVDDELFLHLWLGVVEIDPTDNKIYLDWIIRQILNTPRGYEDADAINQILQTFDRVKRHMHTRQRDINHYRDYHDLAMEVAPYENTVSQREVKKAEVAKYKSEITTLYDGSDMKIYIPRSWEASKFLGRGTKWCTASERTQTHYHYYTTRGPLFVFVFPGDSSVTNKIQSWADIHWMAVVRPLYTVQNMDTLDVSIGRLPDRLAEKLTESLLKHYSGSHHVDEMLAGIVITAHAKRLDLAHKIYVGLPPGSQKALRSELVKMKASYYKPWERVEWIATLEVVING